MTDRVPPLVHVRPRRHDLRNLGEGRGAWRAAWAGAIRELKRDQGLWAWAGAALVLAAAFFAAAAVAATW